MMNPMMGNLHCTSAVANCFTCDYIAGTDIGVAIFYRYIGTNTKVTRNVCVCVTVELNC